MPFTNDAKSLVIARYCQSVLKIASNSSEATTRRLVAGLISERPTPGVSPAVEAAEWAALVALEALSRHLEERPSSSGSAEWFKALRALDDWIRATGADPRSHPMS